MGGHRGVECATTTSYENNMKALQNEHAKNRVRRVVTREIKRVRKNGSVRFTTLFHDNFDHEREVAKAVPDVSIVSLNRDGGRAAMMQGQEVSRRHMVRKGTLGTVHDKGVEVAKEDYHVVWYDFCTLKNSWDGLLHGLERLDPYSSVAFVTFSVFARGWDYSQTLVDKWGFMTTPEDMAEKVIQSVRDEAKSRGFELFYRYVYTVRGGRMLTVGLRGAHLDENPHMRHIIAASDMLRNAGVPASEIAKHFGSTSKIAGINRAATCRKRRLSTK